MSGMADSIRERRAREVPEREAVVEGKTTEEAWKALWEEDEEEWEEPLSEKLMTALMKALGPLIDFVVDVATLAAVPTALLLIATAYQTTFDLETALLLWSATAATLMISNAKQRLLRRFRLR